MKKTLLLGGIAMLFLTSTAQVYKEGYVDWGKFGQQYGTTLKNWSPGSQITEDDNFFISRVKGKERFRNSATQVNTAIDESNDKKLLMWVPIDDAADNALPNGVYDSEVFNMWQYLSHYGNWTAPQGRIPGNFADVAHKNGVGVSTVAGIPYGGIYGTGWQEAMQAVIDAGVEKNAQFMRYYGFDGLGYNSEFSGGYSIMSKLMPFHISLKEASLPNNPLFENIWYDGTSEQGRIQFDQGLDTHNDKIAEGASLFFNYNWNNSTLLQNSVNYANKIGYNPLNLYAGVNMQGAQPASNNWPLLKDYPISIGLWGAHSQNMFWESRGEKGSAPDVKQRTYQLRIERWFTGGTRNPANCPTVSNSIKYNADNFTFHGMSSFMTAKSTLCWDLGNEPFITYFNLGNGKFFNWNGKCQHNSEWYNIGVQDYLPTWRWWFTKSLLGRTADEVAENGLDAEFTWDDAWMGGSTVRIFGSTAKEYLHLFKTKYEIKNGDVITFRYKVAAGNADVKLVLTATGSESTPIGNCVLRTADEFADEDVWVERTFTVGENIKACELALVALEFENVKNLNMYLGEFSIVRNAATVPATPVIAKTATLAFSKHGLDGKIIFNMPNDKAAGEPCYNIDVNTSLFKLYAQQEGCEPILMGVTTSWAGLFYNVPMELGKPDKVRFGVAAVSLDLKSDSETAWGEYMSTVDYVYNDDVQCNKNTIKPGEDFEVSYIDPRHEDAKWIITNAAGETLFEATGQKLTVDAAPAEIGNYNLTVIGKVYNKDGEREESTRTFQSFIQVTSESVGALPKILTLTANGAEADITVAPQETVAMAYTGRNADGTGSQGLNLNEERFGVKCDDVNIVGAKTFSTAFWLKINALAAGETQLLAVANKQDGWPKTDWGWVWINIKEDGSMGSYTFRGTDASSNNELRYKFANTKIPVGSWVHIAFVFEYNEYGRLRGDFYVNGVKQTLTGWNRQLTASAGDSTTDPGYQANVYNITSGQVLSVGGSASGRAGINGVIDNFQIWDKALSDADVALAMGDINPTALPDGLVAYWDFESNAATDHTFKSVGALQGKSAGMHNYAVSGSEGQGTFGWIAPEYTSGCPFISGTAYPVVTTPQWYAKKGIVESSNGNDTAGAATIKYRVGGDYAVTLTLQNSHGSDSRTFQIIKVEVPEGIESVNSNSVAAYTVEGVAFIEFAQEGNYNVSIFNAAGQKVAGKAATVTADDRMQIALSAKGTYILTIEKDGVLVRSIKLFSK